MAWEGHVTFQNCCCCRKQEVGAVTVLPLATGMAITLTLLALRTTLQDPQAQR